MENFEKPNMLSHPQSKLIGLRKFSSGNKTLEILLFEYFKYYIMKVGFVDPRKNSQE